MTEDFEMTEEQRIQFELKKAEQKEKKKKRDRIIFLIIGLFLLSLIVWFVYDQMKPKSQRKPVIYLYPEETTGVEVTLNFAGKLTSTYPAYENGWKVTAEPDGTLTDSDGKVYNYLFWEGVADTEFDFSEGFCVKGSDTAEFLEARPSTTTASACSIRNTRISPWRRRASSRKIPRRTSPSTSSTPSARRDS